MSTRTAPSLTLLNRIACVLATAVALSLGAYSQITPGQDAYTNTAMPTANFGAKTLLDVQSATQNTYIQFDLSSLPAGYSGANIAKATLKLYVNTVPSAGSFNVDFVNGTWSEKTITANLAPALGTTIVPSIPLTSTNVKDYILIDITPALQVWLNKTQPNDGIALVANSPLNATFDSKESTAQSHPPELDVVFTSSGGGGITGINTANGSGLIGGGNSGTLNLSLTNACAANQVLKWSGSAWSCANLSGSGTVTSVGLSAPNSDFTVTGSPITTSGTLGLNWTVAPTDVPTPNAIVKRDGAGGFYGNNVSVNGKLAAGGPAVFGSTVGIGTSTPQANLNINVNGFANADKLLIGNNTTRGLQLRDTGTLTDLESIGVALCVNCVTAQPTYFGNLIGIGTTTPQALLNLNFLGGANADSLLLGNNTTKGLQLRDNGTGVDLESIGVPLYVNFNTHQNVFLNPNGGQLFVGTTSGNGYSLEVGGGLEADGGIHLNGTFILTGGDAFFNQNLQVSGTKNFRIDHPLDPANEYLTHAAIESSEVLNLYTGNARLDAKGEATVRFPAWFSAINIDFRYQLTAVGAPGPNLYIAKEIENGAFRIAGGTPGMKVSWQVTCLRNDPYMKAHPMVVEEEKPASEIGLYRHPELYGQPPEKAIGPLKPAGAGKELTDRSQVEVEK